ncbi:MAG: TIGR03085 family metal-binding protein [Acidimicrobiales bacterium]
MRHNGKGLSLAQQERQALCDLLHDLGPDAPTLCAGWRSADLAAHLVVRDRRPDSIPGAVLRLNVLQGWTKRVRDGVRDTLTWDELLAQLRAGPPAPIRPLDAAVNTIEFFVHHEDVRRAQPGWEPRALADEVEAQLWERLKAMSIGIRLLSSLGRQPPASRAEVPGRPPIVLVSQRGLGRSPSSRPTVLKGQASEVVLWVMGRQSAARVEHLEVAG